MGCEKVCSWEDIEVLVCNFEYMRDGYYITIWETPEEVEWVKTVWQMLVDAGHTTYSDDFEEKHVKILLLNLAALYCRFLEMYQQEPIIPDYTQWIDVLELSRLQAESILEKELEDEIDIHMNYEQRPSEDDDVLDAICSNYVSAETIVKNLIELNQLKVYNTLKNCEFYGNYSVYLALMDLQVEKGMMAGWLKQEMMRVWADHPIYSLHRNDYREFAKRLKKMEGEYVGGIRRDELLWTAKNFAIMLKKGWRINTDYVFTLYCQGSSKERYFHSPPHDKCALDYFYILVHKVLQQDEPYEFYHPALREYVEDRGDEEYAWNNIKHFALRLKCKMGGKRCSVWRHPYEIQWIRLAWQTLRKSYAISKKNNFTKKYIETQIVALAVIYCKFIEIYYKEDVVIDYDNWFDRLHLSVEQAEYILRSPLGIWYIDREVDCFTDVKTKYKIFRGYDKAGAIRRLIDLHLCDVISSMLLRFYFTGGYDGIYCNMLQSTIAGAEISAWIDSGMKVSDR